MAITYTTLATENLGDDQTRITRGRDITGGMLLNVQVIQSIVWPYITTVSTPIVDEELFVPNASIAELSGFAFSVADTHVLDQGQKRTIREYVVPTGGVVTEIIRTQEYKETKDAPTKTLVVQEELSFSSAGFDLSLPWFEWNGEDLDQFDTREAGPGLASSSAGVVTYAGLKWVSLGASSSGVAGNAAQQAVVLPIAATPPSANYRIECDVIAINYPSTLVGAGIVMRFASAQQYYLNRYNDTAAGATGQIRLDRVGSGYTVTQMGKSVTEPQITAHAGVTLKARVEGESIVTMEQGTPQLIPHTSSPITAAGRAGLFCSVSGVINAGAVHYFRNIRCFAA